MATLIETAKLNGIDPQALADVLARIARHPAVQTARVAAVELAAPGTAIARQAA